MSLSISHVTSQLSTDGSYMQLVTDMCRCCWRATPQDRFLADRHLGIWVGLLKSKGPVAVCLGWQSEGIFL